MLTLRLQLLFVSLVKSLATDDFKSPFRVSTLSTVPLVHDNALIPSTRLRAAYTGAVASDSNNVSAIFDLEMKGPSLNLDNFPSLDSIYCGRKDFVTVVFRDTFSATMAYYTWVAHPDLTLFIGHETKCWDGDDDVRIVKLVKMRASLNSVEFQIRTITLNEAIHEYELNVQKSEPNHFIPAWWDISGGKQSADEPLKPNIHREFSFNYNATTKGASNPSINIISDEIGIDPSIALSIAGLPFKVTGVNTRLDCLNCYLTGSLSMGMRIRGSPLGGSIKVPVVDIVVDGNLYYSADFNIKIHSTDNVPLIEIPLFELGLGGFTIPGLFSVGPYFKISTGVGYSISEPVGLSMGFETNIPLSMRIGNTAKSDNISVDYSHVSEKAHSEKFNPHALMHHEHNFNTSIFNIPGFSVSAHLIPSLNLGLEVLGHVVVGVSVGFGNSISYNVKASSHVVSWCPVETSLTHSHSFALL